MISIDNVMVANVLQWDALLVQEINGPLHILQGMDTHFPTCVWYFLNLTFRREKTPSAQREERSKPGDRLNN